MKTPPRRPVLDPLNCSHWLGARSNRLGSGRCARPERDTQTLVSATLGLPLHHQHHHKALPFSVCSSSDCLTQHPSASTFILPMVPPTTSSDSPLHRAPAAKIMRKAFSYLLWPARRSTWGVPADASVRARDWPPPLLPAVLGPASIKLQDTQHIRRPGTYLSRSCRSTPYALFIYALTYLGFAARPVGRQRPRASCSCRWVRDIVGAGHLTLPRIRSHTSTTAVLAPYGVPTCPRMSRLWLSGWGPSGGQWVGWGRRFDRRGPLPGPGSLATERGAASYDGGSSESARTSSQDGGWCLPPTKKRQRRLPYNHSETTRRKPNAIDRHGWLRLPVPVPIIKARSKQRPAVVFFD